jgi:hypothetical protein
VIIDAAEHRRGLPHAFVSSAGAPMGRAERQSSRGQWGPGLPGWGLAFRSPPTRQQVGARRPVAAPGSRDRRVLLVFKSGMLYKVPVTRVLGRLHAKEDQERKRKVAPRATYPRGPWTANTAVRTVNLTVTPARAPAYVARHARPDSDTHRDSRHQISSPKSRRKKHDALTPLSPGERW